LRAVFATENLLTVDMYARRVFLFSVQQR